ncbi:vacuolar protein sorting-associated protein 62, partial [Tanacetum coccineum]
RSASGLFLTQSKFSEEILERAHMQNCNPCRTPVDTESKLSSDGGPVCLYMHDPRDPHFTALKRILRYVRGTLDYGCSWRLCTGASDFGESEVSKSEYFKKDAISTRPTIKQIKTMITRFAPLIYFHPDEEYFPSSVPWFFKNGAQLFDPKPHGITNNGDNLPRNGNLDSAFLDLLSDQPLHDTVKKGSLADAVAYIHAKPVVTGSYTDIVVWLYYPFNGPAKLQLRPFIIPLGNAGQHVSDWEHMRPEVYASLHNHAHYNAPKDYIYYDAEKLVDPLDKQMLIRKFTSAYPRKSMLFSFGPMDKAAKGDCVFDILATPSSYEIVSLDYGADYIVPPPWLDYTGRWGPTIFLGWKDEVKDAISSLPGSWLYKWIAKKIVNRLPDSLFVQEGPAGPKMKPSWYGDESE